MATQASSIRNELAEGFSLRLREALAQRGKKVSATALEREFNLRFRGVPITAHSARKWLMGLSVPTQDKLQVLANWLDVGEDWLRFGEPDDVTSRGETGTGAPPLVARQRRAAYAQEESSLVQDLRLLDARNRRLVTSIIEAMLRDQRDQATSQGTAPASAAPRKRG